jgi:hypothetical protein
MTTMYTRIGRLAFAAVAAAGLVAVAAMTVKAQPATVGPRWQGWIGCWAPAPLGDGGIQTTSSAMLICITPSSDRDVVSVATVSAGKVMSSERIDASGREQAIDAKGCTGMQSAQWSSDRRRVYLKSTANCEGLRSTTLGILSMTASGDWIDVRGVSDVGGENVRVAHYRDVGIPSSVPTEIATALSGRSMATSNARIAAGASINTSAVIEATHLSDSSIVSAWILERGQRFEINATTLIGLADAGVPANVTDAMIAVSNPRSVRVARADDRYARTESEEYYGQRIPVYMEGGYSPWSWGYSPYGYGYPGYGSYYNNYYGSYGGFYGPYGYGSPPIVVVQGSGASGTRGTAVKGHGYTQGSGSSSNGRTATGSQSSSPSSGSQPSASTAPSSAPATSAPARTAHPTP